MGGEHTDIPFEVLFYTLFHNREFSVTFCWGTLVQAVSWNVEWKKLCRHLTAFHGNNLNSMIFGVIFGIGVPNICPHHPPPPPDPPTIPNPALTNDFARYLPQNPSEPKETCRLVTSMTCSILYQRLPSVKKTKKFLTETTLASGSNCGCLPDCELTDLQNSVTSTNFM